MRKINTTNEKNRSNKYHKNYKISEKMFLLTTWHTSVILIPTFFGEINRRLYYEGGTNVCDLMDPIR